MQTVFQNESSNENACLVLYLHFISVLSIEIVKGSQTLIGNTAFFHVQLHFEKKSLYRRFLFTILCIQ